MQVYEEQVRRHLPDERRSPQLRPAFEHFDFCRLTSSQELVRQSPWHSACVGHLVTLSSD